jgi:hypothetical protein
MQPMTSSLSDGWLGVVLDAAPDLPGAFGAGEASDQVQCHVDTGADAGGGDEVAVVDPAVGWADLHSGVKPAQLVPRGPVGRRRPLAEQPGSSVDQSASELGRSAQPTSTRPRRATFGSSRR